MNEPKIVVVIAGPNGAGKTTSARVLLPLFDVTEFVNADVIATEISPSDPAAMEIAAGRRMIERIGELVAQGTSFAFETMLASRTFAPLLRELAEQGYGAHLIVSVQPPV